MGVVVTFPGTPLVSVVSAPGRHSVMLAKPGAAFAVVLCSHARLNDAMSEAREGARMCGWRFVGVFDEQRRRAHEDSRHSIDRGGAA